MVTAEESKQLLTLHGEVRPQARQDWTGSFPIPRAVELFYWEVGPANITIQNHGNSYFLSGLADLWKFQAGYRWNGLSGEPIGDWNDDWLVVANEGGDPFIFDRTTDEVLHAFRGEGKWNASKMFPDLNTMSACLAQIGIIVSMGQDVYMEKDCSIRPKYRELAATRIQELLGMNSDVNAVLGKLGWG